MNRRAFVALAGSALVASPRAAWATGGLDVEPTAGPGHVIRVLLASGSFAPPAARDAWHFAWDGRTYRGTYEVVGLPDGTRGLINSVPLDAYLYGVLSKEVSASWVPAAQQAQAIVSRTYALFKLRPQKPYDIVAGQSDQVYAGIESETVEGRAAVDATTGMLVTYGGLPAHVAYSSCCGGRTADAGDVWNESYPYLRTLADPYCADTPAYAWNADVSLDAVAAAFGASYERIGVPRSVRIETLAPDDRPRAIAFLGTTAYYETTPKAFRAALGAAVVRSTFVRTAAFTGGSLAISGTGRGHGVGLCQWGARRLAERGAPALDVLAFYFPGTSIGRA